MWGFFLQSCGKCYVFVFLQSFVEVSFFSLLLFFLMSRYFQDPLPNVTLFHYPLLKITFFFCDAVTKFLFSMIFCRKSFFRNPLLNVSSFPEILCQLLHILCNALLNVVFSDSLSKSSFHFNDHLYKFSFFLWLFVQNSAFFQWLFVKILHSFNDFCQNSHFFLWSCVKILQFFFFFLSNPLSKSAFFSEIVCWNSHFPCQFLCQMQHFNFHNLLPNVIFFQFCMLVVFHRFSEIY